MNGGLFRSLLDLFNLDFACFESLSEDRRIADDLPDDIDTIGGHRIGPHAHGRPPKEDCQHLTRPPPGNVADFDFGRRGLSEIFHASQFTIVLLSPCIQRRLDRQGRIDAVGGLCGLEFRIDPDRPDGDPDAFGDLRHSRLFPPLFAMFRENVDRKL